MKWSNKYQDNPKSTAFIDSDVFVVAKSIEQTSGALVVGVEYTILDFNAGDDFTNVGGTNVTGTVFTATGTTPTTYSNGSTLTKYESQGFTYSELKAGLGIGGKVYKALLSQSGVSAPTATVLVNTLGVTPTFSYVGVGDYRLIVTGNIFVQAKTAILLAQNIGGGGAIDAIWNSTNDLAIELPSDNVLDYTLITIEVYP